MDKPGMLDIDLLIELTRYAGFTSPARKRTFASWRRNRLTGLSRLCATAWPNLSHAPSGAAKAGAAGFCPILAVEDLFRNEDG
jgi:hypothetical protein